MTWLELAIASSICVLGVPTVAAVAASKYWQTPGTRGFLVGLLAYAVANPTRIALANILKMVAQRC